MLTRRSPFVLGVCFSLAACGAPSTNDGGRDDASSDHVTSDVHSADGSDLDAPAADAPANDEGCPACVDTGVDGSTVDAFDDVATADANDSGGVGDAGDSGDAGGRRGMSVSGARLQRDGANFLPHGFNMIGILTPDACRSAPGMGTMARAAWGMRELTIARDAWHANIVRLQVSQRGLDPMDSLHDAAYVTRVQNGVALARSLGFVVIVSMQDQSNGCGDATELPTAQTIRSWTATAPLFRDDPYVMFELYNEPQNASNAAGWAQWRDGGTSPINVGEPSIGFQALVNHMRNTLHVTNVLLADGANYAGQLQGVPLLTDPMGAPQIAYVVHPYYFHISDTATLAADTANWDTRFGYLTTTAPVLATEWNASASCRTGTGARIPDFFAYLRAHNIGLFGHAFDVVNRMPQNLTDFTPTVFTGCTAGSDAGELVQQYFATLP